MTTTWRDEAFTLPVWLLLVQSINHATEHRAQVAAILTQQGLAPPASVRTGADSGPGKR